MFRPAVLAILCCCPSPVSAQQANEPVFSGPQVGEKLPEFTMKATLGAEPGTDVNFVQDAGDAPVVVVFIHKLTRPGFALARAITKYCLDVEADHQKGICFLSQDPSQARSQIERTSRYFPEKTLVGYSMDGAEGPGSYGLNRKVEVTVVVAKGRKVTANFALIQPGVHADGPKILKAIADAFGAKDVPDINKYLPNNQAAQDTPISVDPRLMAEVRKLNNQNSDNETVAAAIQNIQELIKDNKPLQQQIGSIAARWIRAGRIDQIGTKEQQGVIRKWAQAGVMRRSRQMDRPQRDEKLTGLLRNLIQKTNTKKDVDAAASEIEAYINENETAQKELKRITTTVVNSGKLQNYGTEYCQQKLTAWAKAFSEDKD